MFLLVLRLDITHTGYSGANILTCRYRYILTPPVMCTQQLPVLHWTKTFWYKNVFYRGPQCLYCLKLAHLQKSFICLLDSRRVSPSCEIKNTDRNGINWQNSYTARHTERKRTLEQVSYWHPSFFTNLSLFMGKF